ncbi:MAG TPA: hypothetical protein VKA76_07935 [Gammaproteobacteria bacterium]|nr:hypothetical protein [Gammaproteobacteria bacterium]
MTHTQTAVFRSPIRRRFDRLTDYQRSVYEQLKPHGRARFDQVKILSALGAAEHAPPVAPPPPAPPAAVQATRRAPRVVAAVAAAALASAALPAAAAASTPSDGVMQITGSAGGNTNSSFSSLGAQVHGHWNRVRFGARALEHRSSIHQAGTISYSYLSGTALSGHVAGSNIAASNRSSDTFLVGATVGTSTVALCPYLGCVGTLSGSASITPTWTDSDSTRSHVGYRLHVALGPAFVTAQRGGWRLKAAAAPLLVGGGYRSYVDGGLLRIGLYQVRPQDATGAHGQAVQVSWVGKQYSALIGYQHIASSPVPLALQPVPTRKLVGDSYARRAVVLAGEARVSPSVSAVLSAASTADSGVQVGLGVQYRF